MPHPEPVSGPHSRPHAPIALRTASEPAEPLGHIRASTPPQRPPSASQGPAAPVPSPGPPSASCGPTRTHRPCFSPASGPHGESEAIAPARPPAVTLPLTLKKYRKRNRKSVDKLSITVYNTTMERHSEGESKQGFGVTETTQGLCPYDPALAARRSAPSRQGCRYARPFAPLTMLGAPPPYPCIQRHVPGRRDMPRPSP